MIENSELKLIFESKYSRQKWNEVTKEIFAAELLSQPKDLELKKNEWEARGYELGSFETMEGRLVGIFEIDVPVKAKLQHNRKGLRDLLKNEVYRDNVDAALLVFTQGVKWRFSYVSQIRVYNKETEVREIRATDPKRYTYLMGEGERCKTAADRFAGITQKENLFKKGVTLDALNEAFNVEKMSKAFFDEYRKHYGAFTAFITGEDENNKKVKSASGFLRSAFHNDQKEARDFVKKMLGRIVFLYFLEKKGWLGVPEDKKWGHGNEYFLSDLFKDCKEKDSFYSDVLVPLFFDTLNRYREDDFFKIKSGIFSKSGYNKVKIPYLNGGLFEKDNANTELLAFPKKLFNDLFTFFDQYNFTVYEDSPDEHTVAVDPEMLGHIFENLLEDNKDKGAFYTPKDIVHYMCQESLIEYLCTTLDGSAERQDIERFIKHQEAGGIAGYAEEVLQALYDVKVCDPAIGSGAFPMGILMEILHAVETLYYLSPDVAEKIWKLKKGWEPAKVKALIIQHSIYGVDIEQGAVDIARLRFWLSLVVDEDVPQPLPNLDYKIVVGNSLVSKFEDQIIEIDWDLIIPGAVTDEVKKIRKIQKGVQDKLKQLFDKQDQFFNYDGDKIKLKEEIRLLKIEVLIEQLQLNIAKDNLNATQVKLFDQGQTKNKQAVDKLAQKMAIEATIIKLNRLKNSANLALHFFDWKFDFPEVMNPVLKENGGLKAATGFDIVIGNPPYVDIKGLPESDVKIYFEKFQTTQNRINLYSVFVEKSLSFLNKSGNISFIIPNSILINSSYEKIRRLISERLNFIIKLPDAIFENAIVETIIFQAVNCKSDFTVRSKVYPNNIKTDLKHVDFITNSIDDWKKDPEFRFNIFQNKTHEPVLAKIESNSTKLFEVADFSLGITPYDKYQGHSEETIKNRAFHSQTKLNSTYKPLISGKSIRRYYVDTSTIEEYIKYGDWLGASREERFFTQPRLLVRQIISGKPMRIYCGYTDSKLYFTQIGFAIIAKKEYPDYSNFILLAILNSNLINFYHNSRFLDTEKNVFQKILIANCKKFPYQ